MSISSTQATQADITQAHQDGRKQGLAIAAIAVALVSYLNLLGAEKSILAAVLAVSAMSGSGSKLVRRRSLVAIGLALIHLVTLGVVLVVFWDELSQLIQLINKLS